MYQTLKSVVTILPGENKPWHGLGIHESSGEIITLCVRVGIRFISVEWPIDE